jgi:peroxiredoxin Q/BCP
MLNIGDKVPDFQSLDQDDNTVRLSDYLGKKLIIYFYPKDNTPGCTKQACNLSDNYQMLQDKGYEILGVSRDSAKSHLKFIDKFSLPFKLLVDSDKVLHEVFNTWGEKQMYGKKYMGTLRKTFIIDEHGVLEKIIEKVKTQDHTDQIVS